MLSKEKCEKAIDNVARYCSDYKLCMIPPRFELINELDVLMSLIQEHFEFVELLKPHGYGMLSAEEFEHWISYICKHNADNDMIIMSQNEKFEDLKVGIWVWDDKEKECIYITKTFISISGFNVFTYLGIYQNLEELKKLDMLFEENRFYPVTKALEYQK